MAAINGQSNPFSPIQGFLSDLISLEPYGPGGCTHEPTSRTRALVVRRQSSDTGRNYTVTVSESGVMP